MSKRKLYVILTVLGIAVVVTGGIIFARGKVPGRNLDKVIPVPVTGLSECKWNHVDRVYPSQFVGASRSFTAFRAGYHRLGFCPKSILDVNILEYGNVREASKAEESAFRSVPSDSSSIDVLGRCAGKGLRVLKIKGTSGERLYITVWRVGKRVMFVEEETSPTRPTEEALRQMRKFLEEYACR